MGKYIIEIPDDMIVSRELPTLAIRVQFGNMRSFALNTGLKLTPYDDDAERRSAEKAWELAKKIRLSEISGGMSLVELDKCFGTCDTHEIFSNPYSDAAKMYEAWQKKKDDEIKVGDEVKQNGDNRKYVVISIQGAGLVNCITKDGKTFYLRISECIKTGRHFPGIAELLKKMEGE